MLDYIKGAYTIIPQLIDENPDVIIASSTYPLDNYPAYKLAKKSNAKYVYEVHDLWPLSPMELGGYSRYHPFILLMQCAENFAYNHVDKVVSILPHSKQHMIDHGLREEKFVHIPNGISLNKKGYVETINEDIQARIPRDKFIVGYTGTFGLSNSLHTLFEAASIIRKEHIGIFFILVGKGPEKERLLGLKKSLILDNLIIIDAVPHDQIQSVVVCFDVCVITWNRRSLYQFGVSPNKIFDYMYAGKPIVQAIEAGNDIVSAAQCGVTVEPENPQAIADGILKLYRMSREEREKLGDNGKRYVLANHTYNILAKQFLEAIY
jgi:glycosyltransferase involved in cell wall biosynthesis